MGINGKVLERLDNDLKRALHMDGQHVNIPGKDYIYSPIRDTTYVLQRLPSLGRATALAPSSHAADKIGSGGAVSDKLRTGVCLMRIEAKVYTASITPLGSTAQDINNYSYHVLHPIRRVLLHSRGTGRSARLLQPLLGWRFDGSMAVFLLLG